MPSKITVKSHQEYVPWNPVEDVSGTVWVESMSDGPDGLTIRLLWEESGHRMTLSFEQYVAYRNIDESYRLRTWNNFKANGQTHSAMYVVHDSEWIRWLRTEAGGVLDETKLTHYSIFTGDDCLDVVSEDAPEITCKVVDISASGPDS